MTATTLWSASLPHNAFAALAIFPWSRNLVVPATSAGSSATVFLVVVSAWCSFAPFQPPSFPVVTVGGVPQAGLTTVSNLFAPSSGSGNSHGLIIPNWDSTLAGNINVHGEEAESETTGLILAALIGTDAVIDPSGTITAQGSQSAAAATPTASVPLAITLALTGNLGTRTTTAAPALTSSSWLSAAAAYKAPWPGFYQTEPSVGAAIAAYDGTAGFPIAATWNNQGNAGWTAAITNLTAVITALRARPRSSVQVIG